MSEKYRQKEFFKRMNQLVGGEITEIDWEDYTAFIPHTLSCITIHGWSCSNHYV